ncbi:MAG: hypothetical protein N2320_02505 [Candidatus Bipolaricaulota bacterium]|nr:hypothetical protein [Candidatus Bipolaricaulota bacterium]
MLKKLVLVALAAALPAKATPTVTIYSGGWAHVVETRLALLQPEGELVFSGLPLTALVDSVRVPGLSLTRIVPLRQGPPSPETLVGTAVTVYARGERREGRLVAVAPVLVLATPEGLEFFPTYDRLVAPAPAGPEGLTLRVSYRSAVQGPALLRLSYLAEGFSWGVSYAATLGEKGMEIEGLATVVNGTGVGFRGVTLSLVAGEVYRPTAKGLDLGGARALALAAAPEALPASEYHRYALPGPVDFLPGTSLYPLLSGTLPYARAYRFSGGPVEVRIRFTNALAPLPAGEVRFYEGELFVGAATIPHTPVGTKLDLGVGAAFDLAGERALESRELLGENAYRDAYRIVLRSAKDAPVEVEVVESLPGVWKITSATLPYERLDAGRVLFRVPVPIRGEATLRYTVEWRH